MTDMTPQPGLLPAGMTWNAIAVTQVPPPEHLTEIISARALANGQLLELAGRFAPACWETFARALIAGSYGEVPTEFLSQGDPRGSAGGFDYCAANFAGGNLTGALLVQPVPITTGHDWLAARLGTQLDPAERFRLLSGRPSGALTPRGPVVCFCCDVGRTQIQDAIAGGYRTIEAIGTATRAGTNCGNCRGDLAELLAGRKGATTV
jgi:assimilatory nitrate reductase catalytic subunit